jgi:hypothetical protein
MQRKRLTNSQRDAYMFDARADVEKAYNRLEFKEHRADFALEIELLKRALAKLERLWEER